jgi:polar amino acid transport system permease protein
MNLVDTFFNWEILVISIPALLRGLLMTVVLGVMGIVFGTLAGLGVCMVRLYAPKPLRWLAVAYIDLLRATPILVVLILIYYALPFLDIRLSSMTSAGLAMSLVMAAYSAEIFRSGIESVPGGQTEAANALGLSFFQQFRHVVLPQAWRIVIPPLTGTWVSLIKDTSLASTVALPELLKEALDAQAYHANPTPLIGAAIIYVLLLLPLVRLVGLLEKRANRSTRR